MSIENLTVNERILIHLRDFPSEVDIGSSKMGQTQEGISEGVNVRINHVPRATKKLLEEGYVEEHQAHVDGLKRKRKIYVLTEQGRKLADTVLSAYMDQEVLVRFSDGREESVKLSDIPLTIKTTATASQLLLGTLADGLVLESKINREMDKEITYISNLEDIHRPSYFLGREVELEKLAEHIEGDINTTVVCGIKGIGKTSFVKEALMKYEGRRNILWYTAHEWETARSFFEHMANLLTRIDRSNLKRTLKAKDFDLSICFNAFIEDMKGTESIVVLDNIFNLEKSLMHIILMICKSVKPIEKGHFILITRERDMLGGGPMIDKNIELIHLEGLTTDASFRLMDKLGMDPEEFERIHSMINGHPLALEMINSDEIDKSIDAKGLTTEELWIVKSLKALDAIFD